MKQIRQKINTAVVIIVAVGLIAFGSQILAKGPDQYTMQDLNEQSVMAINWVQTSAEFRALSYQSYNLARMNLDSFLASYSGSKPVAISVDIDETVTDNSAYQAWLIGNDFGYSSKTWGPWIASGQAKAMPGAVEFLNYAKDKGVEIFYISNIKMAFYEGAEKKLKASGQAKAMPGAVEFLNYAKDKGVEIFYISSIKMAFYEGAEKKLKDLGIPFADKKHLLLKTDTSDKQPRRDMVAKDYEIALLLGDNLNDFLSVFRKKPIDVRFAETDKIKDDWGKKFIVFPNPMYGDWEGAIYKGNWGASPAEKDQMRKEHLKRWDYQP
jgi:predicted secreted acid phosphatase